MILNGPRLKTKVQTVSSVILHSYSANISCPVSSPWGNISVDDQTMHSDKMDEASMWCARPVWHAAYKKTTENATWPEKSTESKGRERETNVLRIRGKRIRWWGKPNIIWLYDVQHAKSITRIVWFNLHDNSAIRILQIRKMRFKRGSLMCPILYWHERFQPEFKSKKSLLCSLNKENFLILPPCHPPNQERIVDSSLPSNPQT